MAEVTIYSTIKDGYIINTGGDWATVRNAVVGSYAGYTGSKVAAAIRASHLSGTFNVTRSFFYFDLSGLPINKVVTDVKLYLCSEGTYNSDVSAQEGTQGTTLTTADFDAFTGTKFGEVAVPPTGDGDYFHIPFNTGGKVLVQSKMGTGTVKICCREDDYDYADSVPSSSSVFNGCYFADNVGTDKDPKLIITYSEPPMPHIVTSISAEYALGYIDLFSDITVFAPSFDNLNTELTVQFPPTGYSSFMCSIMCSNCTDGDVKMGISANSDENVWWNPRYGWGCPDIKRVKYYMEQL